MMPTRAISVSLAMAFAVGTATAQTSVGVSIGINQPGVYGRIDIGNTPPPPVIYAKPMIYAPPRVAVVQEPVYLYVPPGHQKKWGKHCAKYNACGQPVYFVQEKWVKERYEREHEHDHGHDDDHGNKHGKKGKHGKD